MIYVLIFLAIALATYAVYLQLLLKKTKKNLKELIEDADKRAIENNQSDDGDIYFKTNLEFEITYVNEVTCKITGFTKEELIGHCLLGTLMENNEANAGKLKEHFNLIVRNQSNLNIESNIRKKNGQNLLMHCRKRPILNEALKCVGISYLCQDVSEAEDLKRQLANYIDNDTLVTNIFNETTFLKRLEHNFNLEKRYNNDFSLIVVELKDIFEFVIKGIDFDTGDKLIKISAELCVKELGKKAEIGRFDKTKIGIILNKMPREEAAEYAQKLHGMVINKIRSLNVDKYNAEMIVVSYTNRKNFNETADTILGRVRKHIDEALKTRNYGIKSSDRKFPLRKN